MVRSMPRNRKPITSLERISKYLPNVRIDHLSRIKIDDRGRIWADEDTILIVLRGHLIIEQELSEICDGLLRQPAVLPDRLNFDTRLRLVRALLGDGEFPKVVYDILQDLNRIRNKLAHNLDAKDLSDDLRVFFCRFSAFPDVEEFIKSMDVEERLNSCIVILSAILEGIKPAKGEKPCSI